MDSPCSFARNRTKDLMTSLSNGSSQRRSIFLEPFDPGGPGRTRQITCQLLMITVCVNPCCCSCLATAMSSSSSGPLCLRFNEALALLLPPTLLLLLLLLILLLLLVDEELMAGAVAGRATEPPVAADAASTKEVPFASSPGCVRPCRC